MATYDVTTPAGANAAIAGATSGDVIRFMDAGAFTGTDITVGVNGLTLIGETPRTNGPRRIVVAAQNTTIADLKVQCDQAYPSKVLANRTVAMILGQTSANTNGLIVQNCLVRGGDPDNSFAAFDIFSDTLPAYGPVNTVGTGARTGSAGGWPLGTVEFYDANTSTPKGATVGGTPGLFGATADSLGLLPVIVLTSPPYRIVHKDSLGNVISDVVDTSTASRPYDKIAPVYVNNFNYLTNLPRGFDATRLRGSVWFEGNTFEDLSEGLKFGVDGNPEAVDVVIRRNDFYRCYQDFISYGLTTLAAGLKPVITRIEHTGNLFQDNFATPQDAGNPHGDEHQIFSADLGIATDTIAPIPNVLIAGNTSFQTPGCRGQASAVFLSDVPPGFPFIGPKVVENFGFGRMDNRALVVSNSRAFAANLLISGSAYYGSHAAYVRDNYMVGNPVYNTPSNREKTWNVVTDIVGLASPSLRSANVTSDPFVAGDSLPLGVVRFYRPGGLIAKNAYSDAAFTVPITSATADASGNLTNVYFKPTEYPGGALPDKAGVYRVTHETAGGTVVMDMETNAAPTRVMLPKGGSRNLLANNFIENIVSTPGNSLSNNVVTGAKSITATSLDTWLDATPTWSAMTTPELMFDNTALKVAYAGADAVHTNNATWDDLRDRWTQTVKPTLAPFIDFVDQLDQTGGATVTSNWQYVHGGGAFSLIGGEYRTATDYEGTSATAWASTATTLTEGQFIQLRATASAASGTVQSVRYNLGITSGSWNVYTTSTAVFPRVTFAGTTTSATLRTANTGFDAATIEDARKVTIGLRGAFKREATAQNALATNATANFRMWVNIQTTGVVRVTLRDVSGGLLAVASTTAIIAAGATPTEIDLIMSIDLSADDATSSLQAYNNGVAVPGTVTNYVKDGEIDFTTARVWQFGSQATPTPATLLKGDVDYFYLWAGQALDLSDIDTRLRFDANRIGPNGEGPGSGVKPHIFLTGNKTAWEDAGGINRGSYAQKFVMIAANTVTDVGSNPWPPVLALSSSAVTIAPYTTGSPITMQVVPGGYAISGTTIDVAATLGGSFVADPVSLPEGEGGATVVFTPSATGSLTISFVHSGTYTNPGDLLFTVGAGAIGGGQAWRLNLGLGMGF